MTARCAEACHRLGETRLPPGVFKQIAPAKMQQISVRGLVNLAGRAPEEIILASLAAILFLSFLPLWVT